MEQNEYVEIKMITHLWSFFTSACSNEKYQSKLLQNVRLFKCLWFVSVVFLLDFRLDFPFLNGTREVFFIKVY